jgi:hypothetical protein
VQLTQFSLCVIAARVCCGVLVIIGSGVLAKGAATLDSLFKGHPTALLLFVMVVFPVMLNTLQALTQDHFLKWRARDTGSHTGAHFPGCLGPLCFVLTVKLSLPCSRASSRAFTRHVFFASFTLAANR